jgi:class 3 adenylate cyclase/alpha-beta hydrolase superfamily lysophospholipase
VIDLPNTGYAKTKDDVHIAYQVVGNGPFDLVAVPGYVSHVELAWEDPALAACLRGLASFSRLIVFDRRGLGLSDPIQGAPTLEDRMQDLQAVMDAAGSERAALFGLSEGGPMSMLFAATYPERVSALVLYGTFARMTQTEDYPWGYPSEVLSRYVEAKVENWGGDDTVDYFAPSRADDPDFRQRFAAFERRATSPNGYRALMQMNAETDVRDVLPSIQAPTLVLHRTDDIPIRVGHGRFLGQHIEGARYVELRGSDHFFWVGDTGAIVDEVAEFLTGQRPPIDVDRILTTVLFTDIVGSTERAAAEGDQRWHTLLDAHDGAVRNELARFRGREIKTMGDGFLACFDGPARAVRCADAIAKATKAIGIDVRCGLHTGECEVRGDDLAGLAVHIASRVGSLASPEEVLVSSTVKDLVAGSGISFHERGEHELKGVPDPWRLFAAEV